MEKRKKQQLAMLNAVLRFLVNSKDLVEKFSALKASFTVYESRLMQLNQSYEQTKKNTTGITTSKQELKKQLAQQVAGITARAHAWAFHNNDHILLEATDYDENDLLRLSDTAMEKTCATILDLVDKRNNTLGDYSIPVMIMGNAQSLCDAFRGDTPAPRNAVSARSAIRKECNLESDRLVNMLEQTIDRLVGDYKVTNPVFHDEYFVNREIVDAGSRTTKITGKVTDKFTGVALHQVQVLATEVNTGVKYETLTTIKGAYTLKIPLAGAYRLVFTHPQYQPAPEQLTDISLGSQPKINMGLAPAK